MVELLGENTVAVADGILMLGNLFQVRGLYKYADSLFSRCSRIYDQVLPGSHPYVARLLAARSENYRLNGYLESAGSLCFQSINMIAEFFPADSALAAMFSLHHAHLLQDLGRYEAAEELYSSATKLLRKHLGASSAQYALALGDMGECLRLGDKTDLAFITLRKALQLRTMVFGENHISVAEVWQYVALLYMDADEAQQYSEAKKTITDNVIPKYEALLSANHPSVLYAKANLGLCINALYHLNRDKSGGTSFDQSASFSMIGPGQAMVTTAISALSKYEQGPFSSEHPWVIRFGGFPTVV